MGNTAESPRKSGTAAADIGGAQTPVLQPGEQLAGGTAAATPESGSPSSILKEELDSRLRGNDKRHTAPTSAALEHRSYNQGNGWQAALPPLAPWR